MIRNIRPGKNWLRSYFRWLMRYTFSLHSKFPYSMRRRGFMPGRVYPMNCCTATADVRMNLYFSLTAKWWLLFANCMRFVNVRSPSSLLVYNYNDCSTGAKAPVLCPSYTRRLGAVTSLAELGKCKKLKVKFTYITPQYSIVRLSDAVRQR